MSNFVNHEPCPECKSRDNLARYSDGSAWCFGCGYYESRTGFTIKREEKQHKYEYSDILPRKNYDWLQSFGLTSNEISLFKYNKTLNRHCFKVGDFEDARSLDKSPKSLSFGNKPFEVWHKNNTLVLVEDIVSAILCNRHVSAMCLFGSHIPFKPLKTALDQKYLVWIWLDSDKLNKALEMALKCVQLDLPVRVIRTDKDPKNLTEEERCSILMNLK